MKYQNRHHTISVYAFEWRALSLGDMDKPQNQSQIYYEHRRGSDKALLLADGAEDEVGMLFRDVFQFCLGAVEESLSLIHI